MEKDVICFYFDESFHSRKINTNTINAQEYFDNYVSVGIGFTNIEKDIELINLHHTQCLFVFNINILLNFLWLLPYCRQS